METLKRRYLREKGDFRQVKFCNFFEKKLDFFKDEGVKYRGQENLVKDVVINRVLLHCFNAKNIFLEGGEV